MSSVSFAERFARICADLARELGSPVPDAAPSLYDPTVLDIEIDGIAFAVIYVPLERPEHLAIVCRLGTLPPENQAPIMRRPLELSFFLAGTDADVGMGPTGDDALMTMHASLATVSAAVLVQSLRAQAMLAKQWRADHFLSDALVPGMGSGNFLATFGRQA